jgi:lipopolysaccharide transport system permease protein
MEAHAASSRTAVRTIEPPKRWPLPNLGEVWEHRDLLYFMARRDVAIRYKQSLIGLFWAVLQPIVLAGVFTVFLSILQKVDPPHGIPYGLYALSGMVLWLLLSGAVQLASESTVSSAPLIRKIYFPRLIVPLAAIAPAAVDFAIGFVVVVIVAAAYGYYPGPELLALPLVIAFALLVISGFALWLSALNVRYRDVHLAVPLIVLIGLFISPILYGLDTVQPEWVQNVYALNPVVGVMEVYRWMLLGSPFPEWQIVAIPIAVSTLLLVTGVFYFQRAEQSFADVI